jgi:hypothetical protein
MAISSQADGSVDFATEGLDSEETLATVTEAGVFCLDLDMNAAAVGDIWIVRVKKKVRTGGTTRLWNRYELFGTTIAPTEAEKIVTSIPYHSLWEIVFTLEQTDGTGRAIPWEIVQLQ